MTTVLGLSLEDAPVVLLVISLVAAVAIFVLPEDARRARTALNLGAALVKVGILATLVPFVMSDEDYPDWSMQLFPGIDLVLRIDSLSLLFAGLSSVLWLVTTVYAIGYLEGKPNRRRFFGFFSLCVTSTVGIAFAGNLVTFLLFYEMLTLVTYPLVAHYGTPAALKAARLYLGYALSGGLALLVGTVWLTAVAGPERFLAGGAPEVAALAAQDPVTARLIFVLLVAGLGVKAALVPLHGWLPRAMVAPAPVSALLHAVAVVKAGAFGLVRVIDDLYGVDTAHELGVLTPVLMLAALTILYGSLRALFQDDLKKRLAYSTVSQVSYITLGLTLYSVTATAGGVVHLVHQGLTKITLFFCAGLFAEEIGVKKISELDGVGRRMPWTSAAFTVGALGMIGLPPLAGFVSKWQLGLGALEAGRPEAVMVLVASAFLNAAYFLPVVHRLWFREPAPEAPWARPEGVTDASETSDASDDPAATPEPPRAGRRWEAKPALLLPALVTAVLAIAAGVGAGLPFAPWDIAQYIAERSYR